MVTNRGRGNAFERYLLHRAEGLGFIDVERQPLSGQLPQAAYKSDVKMSILTPDERRIDFLVSCKKTIDRNTITFQAAWIPENEKFASAIGRTSLIGFALGGKPGQKLSVHIFLSKADFIRMTGNIRELNVRELKFRGQKYMSMTRGKLDECRHRGKGKKYHVCAVVIVGNIYYVFEIEDFYKAIMTEYLEEKVVNPWF